MASRVQFQPAFVGLVYDGEHFGRLSPTRDGLIVSSVEVYSERTSLHRTSL